jgi:hypothetical protein
MNSSNEKLKNYLSSPQKDAFDFAAATLLQNDKDLYRLCLYEKDKDTKRSYFAVFALLTELEKVRLISGEEQIGTLRIKWWYDAISKHDEKTDEQTQLLIALKSSISSGHISKDSLLELIEVCAEEAVMPSHPNEIVFETHIKDKGEKLAKTIFINQHLAVNLCWLRAIKYFHFPDIELEENDEYPSNIFENKLSTYIKLLNKNIKHKNQIELGVIDLIRLHF